MKLFNKEIHFPNLFKKKEPIKLGYDIEDLKKIKKKYRAKALKLLKEYENGLVISVDKDINQKEMLDAKRKEIYG
jgi:hypothetical protein